MFAYHYLRDCNEKNIVRDCYKLEKFEEREFATSVAIGIISVLLVGYFCLTLQLGRELSIATIVVVPPILAVAFYGVISGYALEELRQNNTIKYPI